jgi:3-dehydroquinate synthase
LTGNRILVITNPTVRALYGGTVQKSLAAAGFVVCEIEIPDGEEFKTLDTVKELYGKALDIGLERGDAVVALGGGVVGDTAGFFAATYKRGVALVQVPTTLLAQVDSSVGGKVGVNHPRGKNLIGAFHQPRFVVADVTTLNTLPVREIRAGLAEIIKYGIIRDVRFFEWLENRLQNLLNLEQTALEHAVSLSCRIKADVVSADEREEGIRAILNYGHTVAHALEAVGCYHHFVHGEAVGVGMVAAARLAVRLGMLSVPEAERIAALVARAGLPVEIPAGMDAEEIISAMFHDKKVVENRLTFVLPEAIGRVRIAHGVPVESINAVLTGAS